MSEERFAAAAPLPGPIHRLHELAVDLWWSWDLRAREVFRRLDHPLWRRSDHNPVKMLQRISAERLRQVAAEPRFLQLYDETMTRRDEARGQVHSWWS
jgi:starch phosphorylase